MGAYIVGMITGTVCLVASLCYLGVTHQVQVPLAIATTITGLVVLLVSTLLAAFTGRCKMSPAKPAPTKSGPASGPAPEPKPDEEAVELPGIDKA